MAQNEEFPWHAESHLREPTYLDEKAEVRGEPELSSVVYPSEPSKHAVPQFSKSGLGKRVQIANAPEPQSTKEHKIVREGAMHVPVRTIPPWVRDAEESDLEDLNIDLPHAALVAQHNHSPWAQLPLLGAHQHHQHARHPPPERTSRWLSFARAGAYPREDFDGEIVDEQWLAENGADYSKPWLEGRYNEDDAEEGDDTYRAFRKRRKAWYKRAQFTILRNPFVPLAFRFTVVSFALAAMAIGASVFHETNKILACTRQSSGERSDSCINLIGEGPVVYYRDPSPLMAIIVDAIAVLYTLYITYDEYFSKPLGLRSARHKVRLVLLDIFFIVFQSANLSLSFSSLTVDKGACAVGDQPAESMRFSNVCDRQEALSSVLLVSLVAWLFTFSVSVLRLVERINTR